ncbi:AAA family ATPase [Pectobacterium brasiliense]|uniref:AAA family ATPase n=1 Tax=Pectobacterium brasiliense TaxID=180957 RepID=UPI00057F4817|nr:AAA family ATPase [Pectobacterium brasiliense]KHT43664.1 hypothetical protein RD02_02640 [Pectobacterium brasiliense]MBN3172630.1 AAA family ATPase [Pectobacterium brasiliense]MBN3198127.1 AAA family ATPase [Pectobacterium brasiliense]
MLRIERIIINGFKSEKKSVQVLLSASNVSVVFGQNGCGKTSLLKIIHAILTQNESVLIQNQISSIDLYYSNGGSAQKVTIKKSTSDQDKKNYYNWNQFIKSELFESSSLSLGVDRGMTSQPAKVEPRMIYDFFRSPFGRRFSKNIDYIAFSEELADHIRLYQNKYRDRKSDSSLDFEKKNVYLQSIKMDSVEDILMDRYRMARLTATKKIQSALFDTLSIAISLDEALGPQKTNDIPDNFNSLILENASRIVEALDDGSENNFKTKVIQILSKKELESELDKLRSHPILSQLLINMINELKLEKQMLSSINTLIEVFNDFLLDDKELVVNSEKVYVKIGTDRHSINELSSGERHILTFLSIVLFEGGNRNFLIIDEPEISLNLRWQRKLMGLFSELIPHTQIIVASHSPSLANNNPHYLCELELVKGDVK